MPKKRTTKGSPPAVETGVVEREVLVPESLVDQVSPQESSKGRKALPKMPESLRSELADMLSRGEAPAPGSVVGRDQTFDGKKLVLNGVNVVDEDPADDRRFIPHKDVGKRLVPVIETPTVLVADIATPEGKLEYERAIALISKPQGGYLTIDKEVGPEIILDPTCARGFRAIIVLKYAKISRVVVVTQQAYEEVREEDLKKRFGIEGPSGVVEGKDPSLTGESPVDYIGDDE